MCFSRYVSITIAVILISCFCGVIAGIMDTIESDDYDWISSGPIISTLYSGIQERCMISGIAPLSIVEVFQVWTNDNGATAALVVTNCLGPFDYTVDSYSSTHYPPVSRYFMTLMDNKIKELYASGRWVATNMQSSGNYNAWFSNKVGEVFVEEVFGISFTNNVYVGTPPIESFAGACYRYGFGWATNLQTNVFGFVTNGVGYFTREIGSLQSWELAETIVTNIDGGLRFAFRHQGTFDTNYYSPVFPVLIYATNGPVAFSPCTVIVVGSYLDAADASGRHALHTDQAVGYSMTSMTQEMDKLWFDITNMVLLSAANTGDVVRAAYVNPVVLYGEHPYEITAGTYNERVQAVKALTTTWTNRTRFSDISVYSKSAVGYRDAGIPITAWSSQQVVWANVDFIGPTGSTSFGVSLYRPNQSPVPEIGTTVQLPASNAWAFTSISTNIAHAAQWYMLPQQKRGQDDYDWVLTFDFYDLFGGGTVELMDCHYGLIKSYEATNTNRRVFNDLTINNANPNTVAWPSQATADDVGIYKIQTYLLYDESHILLMDWSVEDGFYWR